MDITPVLFLPASISLAFGVNNFQFLKVLLIGRERVFEKISSAIFVLDSDRRIIDLNRAGEELIGEIRYHGNGIGKNAEEIFSEKLDFTTASDLDRGARREFELKVNGNERYFEARVDPILEDGERPIGWVMIIGDITAREEAEKRRDFLNTLLIQDLVSKHQTVQGYLQLIEEEELSEEQEGYLKNALKAGEEVGEILGLAKGLEDMGKADWLSERDIVSLLDRVVDEVSDLIEMEEVQIEKNYPEVIGRVRGSYSLQDMFLHLLKARIRTSEIDRIKIGVEEKEGRVLVKLEDNGKKVSEDIKKLFSGMIYGGETAGAGGARYYMIGRMAKSNEAEIEVQDSEMGGARFKVKLRKA